MTAPTNHTILKNNFWLTHQRCIYWDEEQALILADLHFGKTGHFRKGGIAVPQKAFLEDLQKLVELVSHFNPKKIIAVGDMFHSHANKEHDLFSKWRNDLGMVEFILVKGNHDILPETWYSETGIILHSGLYTLGAFGFIHDPVEKVETMGNPNFLFSGHIHPGVRINGLGKQSLQFPCYYFSENQAILPAFSNFSGLCTMKKKKNNQIYAIVNQSLVAIQ